ncbi:hypothetical protein CANARDRAFT_28278 [[Candida] arabinofermentans NRRL YB-2248]|uniref:AB hydrolase-1 domain-containing protein n=1 Tax=[Candida] arabinofermentans NRRL YB-2248 TaxID=983967 RepID=A0A1E4T190_9ASCO|nr:hypothetical protein CANARDRAFT_28278 [[Candida] arabinofermentans NRRL YB-2248]
MLSSVRRGFLSRSFHTTCKAYTTSYDGTPKPLISTSASSASYKADMPSVKLPYDKYSPSGTTTNNPLIFLHGLFGSKSNTRTVSKKLAELLNRDVYCLDLRNHGNAPHAPTHEYLGMCSDVEKFICDHGLNEANGLGLSGSVDGPIVIGHSMGGKVAMGISLRKPELIGGIIVVDNAPVGFTKGFSQFGKYVQALKKIERMGGTLKSLKDCDAVLAEVEPNDGVRQFLMTNLKRRQGGKDGYYCRVPLDVMGKGLDNVADWPFQESENCRYSGPSLFVRGTKSLYVADEYLAVIGKFFPRFEVRDVDAGHWLISEKPDEFIQAVVDWVEIKEDQ